MYSFVYSVLFLQFFLALGQVPGPPTITSVLPQSRSAVVVFTASSGTVDHYLIAINSTNDDIPVHRSLESTTTVASINGLEEAVDYVASVTAINTDGQSSAATRSFRTTGSIPNGPPTNVATSTTKTSVTLSWQPPSLIYRNTFNGITKYYVKVKKSSERNFPSEGTNVTTATHTVENLNPGIEYDFLILAGNEFGFSADNNGAEVTTTTNEDVPSPPLNVTVVTQFTRAIVYWRPPMPSNGELTKYQIKYYNTKSPSDVRTIRESAASLFRLITSLEEGEEFALMVRAATAEGWGEFSPTQRFTVTRQAVLEDTCALNDTVVRMVFVYSPVHYSSVTNQGVKVFVSETSSSEYTIYSAVYPQNYVDIPVSSSSTLFWRYSVVQLYNGISVQEELSQTNELLPGKYYQCPEDRVLVTPTALLPHPTGSSGPTTIPATTSGTAKPTTPCITVVQQAPPADDHTLYFATAGVGGVVCVALIVAIAVIVTVCVCRRGSNTSSKSRPSVRYNIEATDFGREDDTDDDNVALINRT
jgi:hypothetical protein